MINDTFVRSFAAWTALWVLLIALPPGPTKVNTQYRLNFSHAVLSCTIATLVLWRYVDSSEIATSCTISYFIIDFINIVLNDFVLKGNSYLTPKQRRMEYFHHIFCGSVGIVSEIYHKQKCSFEINPFVNLMYAEFSTISLMPWRYYGNDFLGYIFAASFVLCRIIYHAFIFIPQSFEKCDKTIMYAMGVPYNLMNFFFLYFILSKLIKTIRGSKDSDSNFKKTRKEQ